MAVNEAEAPLSPRATHFLSVRVQITKATIVATHDDKSYTTVECRSLTRMLPACDCKKKRRTTKQYSTSDSRI